MLNQLANTLKRDADIGIIFRETDSYERIGVSMRSNKLILDEFASLYGGGAHQQASALILKGKKDKVISDFIEELQDYNFKEN